ncbi:unnamed protein product [Rotaria sordida]|uniref:DNA primase n=1 Tax=Rotaria sordida TaxID=392033 RepID=A0A819PD04_9BILA|nr:unnamed protein product [Rotaria sordida]CAF4010849.1 unnamed protein product [Rotaria sordida]
MSFVVKTVGIVHQATSGTLLWNGTTVHNMCSFKIELRAARSSGLSTKAFYDNLEVEKTEGPQKHLFIGETSDCGLCGAANSSIVKNIRTQLTDEKENFEGRTIIAIGDKSRTGLSRTHSSNILLSVNEIGKRSLVFADIVYNRFKSTIAYTTSRQKILSGDGTARSKSIQVYDSTNADILRSFQEFNLASVLYYTMEENATSEQSSPATCPQFAQREFSFTLENDVYRRYLSFSNHIEFEKELIKMCPEKIDKDHKILSAAQFYPIKHELVFDIDMTDYDHVRFCCRFPMEIIDRVLHQYFGFEHRLWIYSGRRRVHCWVCDQTARELQSTIRQVIVEHLTAITNGKDSTKCVTLYSPLHPSLQRAREIVLSEFGGYACLEQDFLIDDQRIERFIRLVPDDNILFE